VLSVVRPRPILDVSCVTTVSAVFPHGGDSIAFRLTANPIVSLRDEQDRQRRVDVGDRACALGKNPLSEYKRWLIERLEKSGGAVSQLRLQDIQKERFCKPSGRTVTVSFVQYQGTCRVEDEDLFSRLLARGLGHGKAWGCGLTDVWTEK